MLAPLANFIGTVSDRRSSTAVFTLFIFVAFALLDAAADKVLVQVGIDPDIHASVQASLVGLAASAVAFVLLRARRERRAIIRDEIERVIELNHRLRNALQVIADVHYCEPDEARRKMMLDAVHSMDVTLKQLFPVLGVDRRRQTRHGFVQSESFR